MIQRDTLRPEAAYEPGDGGYSNPLPGGYSFADARGTVTMVSVVAVNGFDATIVTPTTTPTITLKCSLATGILKSNGAGALVLAVAGTDYLPVNNPALAGVPTAPTAAPGTNTTQVSTTGFVAAAMAALVASSPSTLDTLNELAAALGNDPNFATTMATTLGLKAPLASPALTGAPTAPTAAAGTNTTQLATTAFVAAYLGNPATNGFILSSTTAGVRSWVAPFNPAVPGALGGTTPAAVNGTTFTSNVGLYSYAFVMQPGALISVNSGAIAFGDASGITGSSNTWACVRGSAAVLLAVGYTSVGLFTTTIATIPGALQAGTYAFAALPAGAAGMRAFVTNNSAGAAFGSAANGSGAVTYPVYHDGTSWKIG